MSIPVRDSFWADDPSILVDTRRLTEFFPSKEQTDDERLNALTRLGVYISFVLYMYSKRKSVVYIAVFFFVFTYVIRVSSSKQVALAPAKSPGAQERLENVEKTCTPPTLDNPFMNVTFADRVDNPNRPPPCDPSDPEVKKSMDAMFSNNLYRDTSDLFGKMNSQRQFFTMPSGTIPHDSRGDFAKWLYLSPKTCKEDSNYCLRYEDIRQNRFTFPDENANPSSTKKQDVQK